MSKKNGDYVQCAECGKSFYLSQSRISRRTVNCCSKECSVEYNRKRASVFCKQINPVRMTEAIADKISKSHRQNHPRTKGYKTVRGGRHEHRVVAEQKIGRPLKPGEVVHHIDGNKMNNSPENLMVLANTAEHNKLHPEKGHKKEVMPYEVHTT